MYYNNQNVFAYVNGYESARSYQTMPNQNVLLIDTDNPFVYMKQTNAMGQSTIQCFKIEQIKESEVTSGSISKDDIESILKRLDALEKQHESTI